MKNYDVVIIGGGPAGLFTGIFCATNNKRVAILEKNNLCGRKLLMTGAGKCNITQAGDMFEFLNSFGKNAAFLKHALLNFTNKDLLNFFEQYGMSFVITQDNKVFPKSLKAQDILDILLYECQKRKVDIITQRTVNNIEKNEDNFIVITDNDLYKGKHIIIATGGMSYPLTGSTGDGQRLAKSLGHKIIPMKPALTPIKIKNYTLSDLSGISFPNLRFTLWKDRKKVASYQGDVLLTHTGLSGPGILNNSRDMYNDDILKLNFTGQLIEAFRQEFATKLNNGGKILVKTFVKELPISKRFSDLILKMASIDEDLKCAELKKENRQKLLSLLTEFEMQIKDLGNFNVAMVTTGGVSLREINPKTMESCKVSGLYFVGEVLDIDGNTGGYNLQAAFSTAYIAAQDINKKE